MVGTSGAQKIHTASLRTAREISANSLNVGSGQTSVTNVAIAGNSAIVTSGTSIKVQHTNSQQATTPAAESVGPQATTITVSQTGNIASGGPTNNASIQLVGTIQQGSRNIQVVGAKQITTARQIITTQRQIGCSTLKLATASNINGE